VERKQEERHVRGIARRRSGTSPPRASSSLSLQATFGNRALAGLVQRWRDESGWHGGLLQRTFTQQGKRRNATTYGPGSELPKIQGVKPAELRLLADDGHDYGAIEDKNAFALAWALYQTRHTKQVEVLPLDEEQDGNVTLLDLPAVDQTAFAGTVRMTFQLDWLQGKHDQPFMLENSSRAPRKSGENQMRQSLGEYQGLARGAPQALAQARLAQIFAKRERVPLDFSVMDTKQSDDLYYEISATWATVGPAARHVLVYYHCFPDEKDQKKFGFSK
jgi:hypothetical protein